MNEELRVPLTEKQRDEYLARIGAEKKSPSAEYLNEIVRRQLRTIPFDDADVWTTGNPPSLATEDLFDKIITRHRGGYCFELNSLFCKFLVALGFDAYLVIIHLGRGLAAGLGAPAHCGVIVRMDGVKYFADVGYGGPVPDGAVPFGGEIVNDHRQYTDGVYTVVAAVTSDGEIPRFTFKDVPCDVCELLPLNYYVSKREGSGFASDLKMNMRYDGGFAEIGRGVFKYANGDTVIEKTINSPEEAKKLAKEYFFVPDLPVREF